MKVLHFFEFVQKDDALFPLSVSEKGGELSVAAVGTVASSPETAPEQVRVVANRLARNKQKVVFAHQRPCGVAGKLRFAVARWTKKQQHEWAAIAFAISKASS